MKVALVYDRVNKWGGAERVLLTLHKLFPEAPLYTSVYDPLKTSWANVFSEIVPSYLQKFSWTRSRHEKFAPLMPSIFESFDFKDFDLVISVTSEAAKGILTRGKTKHISYCLTPTRYLWSGYENYFDKKHKKLLSKPIVSYLKKWDQIAAHRPDEMIAISSEVQKRIKKYYKRDTQIIHPPVNLEKFKINKNNSKENFFLVVSRLVPYKKVYLVVDAFNKLKLPLIIIGTGSEENKLKNRANSNIKFLSHLTDESLANYYKKARGLIFPQLEDFGLVAVEALASGTPVLAFGKGGIKDIIKEGVTGVFFDKQTVESLISAFSRFSKENFDKDKLVKSSERFSERVFKEKFLNLLKE